jgi:lysylphosphatidylglycerol synthetase-like protein (DUF2156 family)
MKESNKFVSPALFLLVALCFFLPFVSFTCQGQRIATITGMELVTGTKIEKFQMQNFNMQQEESDLDKERDVNSEPLAVAAFIFAIMGIVVSLIPRYSKILSIILGALGVLMLLFLRSSIGGEVTGDFDFKIVEVSYEWGYYFALLLFAAGFALNLYWKISENKLSVSTNADDINFSDAVLCPKCGYSNSTGSIFCSKCGHTLTPEGNL